MKKMTKKADIALIGLGVMGENLARNMERNGFTVAVANRSENKTIEFIKKYGKNRNFIPCHNYTELVATLKSPRIIFIMVKAGEAVDNLIEELLPLLKPNDIIIDGGNSHYLDTQRRERELASLKINFVGCGVSGGESGALKGPSIMPGGNINAWATIKPILQKISAKATDHTPCCQWIGSGGAGHFVKMVHNGIEYGDMELIAESYYLLRYVAKLQPQEIANLFKSWNQGENGSYLLEITSHILEYYDKESDQLLIDLISDRAGQKGTGSWTVQAALDLGVDIPTITTALFMRTLSSNSQVRNKTAQLYPKHNLKAIEQDIVKSIQTASYCAKICSYAQGFRLLSAASATNQWELDFAQIASIWRNGCIIRAEFLDDITVAFQKNPTLEHLLLDEKFYQTIAQGEVNWRKCINIITTNGAPCPALSSALSWFDAIRCNLLPTNIIQAQRDYFGAHTYERTDSEQGNFFHTNWSL